jgi:hypothetical protein
VEGTGIPYRRRTWAAHPCDADVSSRHRKWTPAVTLSPTNTISSGEVGRSPAATVRGTAAIAAAANNPRAAGPGRKGKDLLRGDGTSV